MGKEVINKRVQGCGLVDFDRGVSVLLLILIETW